MQKFAPALVGWCILIIVGDNVKTAAAKTKDSDREEQFLGIIKEMETEIKELRATNVEQRKTIAEERTTNVEQRKSNVEQRKSNVEQRKSNVEQKATIKELRKENRLMKKQAVAKRQDADVKPSSTNGSLHTLAADLISSKQFCISTLQKYTTQKTWAEARAFCQNNGGDLASFPDHKLFLRAQKKFGGTIIWIGGSHANNGACARSGLIGQWTWVSGENLPMSYPYWAQYGGGIGDTKEPTVSGDCCLMTNGTPEEQNILYSEPCANAYEFLCQY